MATNPSKIMGYELCNGLTVLAYLILGTAIIVSLGYWTLKKFGRPKK